MSRALRKWLIRAAGSFGALALIFWFLPKEAILEGFARLTPGLFLGVFAAFLAAHVAAACKWWLLMDRALPFGQALRAHFAGLAANLALPGAAGGDAVRAGLAHVALKDGPKVAAAAVGDRLIDMVGLAGLSLLGLAFLAKGGNPALAWTMAGVIIGGAILALFIFPAVARGLWGRFPALPAKGLALRLADAFGRLGRRPLLLLFALLFSAAIQSLLIWLSVRLALPVGVDVPLAAWFFAWPLAKIVSTLPISLGGLGVRESSLAALLVPFGASAPEVVASGLAWQGILYLTGILGALVLTFSGLRLTGAAKVIED
ncbi:lysylphosphatidylglycerol synthase transmembrane domain-containing protein [Frigidibacter sp. SD6-1]|uniref:lysylphosphatidylglycerol synthase transmembrane domain-containing protein n=1 Tax=Frigidibacter sp. SD6-1 TaxID=3032581 RepID=UPI0024E01D80|nr:lysylphosphatidylglycerol synthase transmembrane domain-containing protein [Frigidibacter sp. SD6-1]